MRSVGILLLLSGCQQIFGFQSATTVDAVSNLDSSPPDAGPCTVLENTCADATTLRQCTELGAEPIDTACAWTCNDDDIFGPACTHLDPTGDAVTTFDLEPDPTLLELDIAAAITINSDTGSINNGVRGSGTGVVNGIDFQVRNQVGVFRFGAVNFQGAVLMRGSRATAIVANGSITINAVVDALGPCTTTAAGPGGSAGGNPANSGQGAGRGIGGGNAGINEVSGGGGGAHGVNASDGGDGGGVPGGAGGVLIGTLDIANLVGGSGGGGGGRPGDGGVGGGGGGAVFFVSNTSINIVSGGINAGGCGGRAGQNAQGGGGGGGAGGAILLEAPTVTLEGGLAVNGGGGGAGGTGENGANGGLETGTSAGGISDVDGNGGFGAANATSGTAGQNDNHAGGGGGSVGRIRINTRNGSVTLGAGGFVSPGLDVPTSTATSGTAIVQ